VPREGGVEKITSIPIECPSPGRGNTAGMEGRTSRLENLIENSRLVRRYCYYRRNGGRKSVANTSQFDFVVLCPVVRVAYVCSLALRWSNVRCDCVSVSSGAFYIYYCRCFDDRWTLVAENRRTARFGSTLSFPPFHPYTGSWCGPFPGYT